MDISNKKMMAIDGPPNGLDRRIGHDFAEQFTPLPSNSSQARTHTELSARTGRDGTHVLTTIHVEQLGIAPKQAYRACLDGNGDVMAGYYVAADGSVLSIKQRKPRILRQAVDNSSEHRCLLLKSILSGVPASAKL